MQTLSKQDFSYRFSNNTETTLHNLKMSPQPPVLPPASIHLPSEIISMIAEACIEPFSITVDKHTEDDYPWNMQITVPGKLPASTLAIVSRDFQNGVKRGMQNSFSGHLNLPVGYTKRANDILESHGLSWVIHRAKHLHLRLREEDVDTLDSSIDQKRYMNVKDITITYKRANGPPEYFLALRGTRITNSSDRVRNVVELLKQATETDRVIFVKVTSPEVLAEPVTSYFNAEIQVSGAAAKVLMRYTTDTLEWGVRSAFKPK